MIKFIKNLIYEIKLLSPFGATLIPLKLTPHVEKFDVVKRAPGYVRIKV